MEHTKRIEAAIAKEFNVEENFVSMDVRKARYTIPKKLMCYILREKEAMTLTQIGEYMNFKTHSSVLHHLKSFEGLYRCYDGFRERSDRVINQIYTKQTDEQHAERQETEGVC